MAGDFEAQVKISESGQVSGRVLDRDTDDDYLALRVERQVGTFVGQVRQAYTEILSRIADACFEALPFIKNQTNRLAQYMQRNMVMLVTILLPSIQLFLPIVIRIITNGMH